MTDLDRIRRDLVACRDIPWSCSCVEPDQLAAIVEEVERLRGERASMDEWLRTMVPNDKATAAERTAVVAWLRLRERQIENWPPGGMNEISLTYNIIATSIERGEHRREEEK